MNRGWLAFVAAVLALVLVSALGTNLYLESNESISNLNSTVQGLNEQNANLSSRLSSLEFQISNLKNQTARLEASLNLSESEIVLQYDRSGLAGRGETILASFNAAYPGYVRLIGYAGGDIISYVKVYSSFTGRNDTIELPGPFDIRAAVMPGTVEIFLTWQFYGNLYFPGNVSMSGSYYY